ncbi:hypothetical protein [Caballeronia sp. LZ003]
MRDITYFYLAWRSDRVGRALQWWVDQLDRPDLIDEAAHQRIAAA